jgi:molybdopterin-guanine dinucleotide biosynthesis protein B
MRMIGLSGWSGAGKTTLIASLIPSLQGRGLSVSTVKHAHHSFEIDRPGKDSFVHRAAGAREVLVTSRHRWALMHELREEPEPPLRDLLARLSTVDLVIVEGFKTDRHPKLEIHRVATDKAFIHPGDPFVLAIATDAPGPFPIPRLDIDDIAAITDWVLAMAMPIEEAMSA